MSETQVTKSQVINAYKNKEYSHAHSLAEIYLSENPKDQSISKLSRKIVKYIYKENLEKVKTSINNIKFMWKQKKYKELLDLYIKLHKYAPNFNKLNNLIEKANNCYLNELKESQESNILKVKNYVSNSIKIKHYNEALEAIEKSMGTDRSNPFFIKLLLDTKRIIIDNKLKDNNKALKNSNAISIYEFIQKLYQLEPTYFKIQKLLNKTHKQLELYYENERKNFEKNSQREIKVLYNQYNFEKAFTAINELLRINPNNIFAVEYLGKVRTKISNQNINTAYQKMQKSLKSI